MKTSKIAAEKKRLQDNDAHRVFWKKWGPYLSERQWGTVREDYSENGDAWNYFPFEQSHCRVYRWGEDGIAGISDIRQDLCFAIALWNGRDRILKERLFGLNSHEGNHGEDVKELYYYLDNTPTHSYMKYLYKYPQTAFPYAELKKVNQGRSRRDSEYEITDTGVFQDQRYFDIFVEYAKAGPDDILIRIEAFNRGREDAGLTVLPSLWFRNTWTYGKVRTRPDIALVTSDRWHVLKAIHEQLGTYYFYAQKGERVLFTENETNRETVYQVPNESPFVKDAFHTAVTGNSYDVLAQKKNGTKCAVLYHSVIPGGGSTVIKLRLVNKEMNRNPFAKSFDDTFQKRIQEADEFYQEFVPEIPFRDNVQVQRQAFAGLLWSKQYYNYEIETWLSGDPGQPPPPDERKRGRNHEWPYLFNRDIISMPDKWEYPWYASWDLAFHCIPLSRIDPDFAKKQLILFLREWYMHPNGQLAAYEWNFSDVNPPVHAWAAMKVYTLEKRDTGKGDIRFLKRIFHKLLLNFTWWVNRKDAEGRNIFQGGFLGLDNIGAFDRSGVLPDRGHIEQADGTSWMAMYALNLMDMALEIAREDPAYEDTASKFFEHFVHIAESLNQFGEHGLWHEEDGFYYDALHFPGGSVRPLRVRSLVGLTSLFAVSVIDKDVFNRMKGFKKRLLWFRNNRLNLNKYMAIEEIHEDRDILLSLVPKARLIRILQKMLDENEFLSPGGIRSISRYHRDTPFIMKMNNKEYRIDYEPGESTSGLYGGNSNWRGPVWLPTNYLFIESLKNYYRYYGDSLIVEFPSGSGNRVDLWEAARQLSQRISSIFLSDKNGRRPVYADDETYMKDSHFRDLVLFHEYFHGETGKGLGASHQTGWTGLIAEMIEWCWCD